MSCPAVRYVRSILVEKINVDVSIGPGTLGFDMCYFKHAYVWRQL